MKTVDTVLFSQASLMLQLTLQLKALTEWGERRS